MKNKKLFIILGVILGVIVVFITTFFIFLTPVSKSNKVVEFTVKKGEGKETIIANLKDDAVLEEVKYSIALSLRDTYGINKVIFNIPDMENTRISV